MSTEGYIQNKILDYLTLRSDVWCWRNNNGATFDPRSKSFRRLPKHCPKGVPDILGIHISGRLIGLEVKSPTGSVSKHQSAFLEKLKMMGAIAGVVRSVEDVSSLLENQDQGKRE